MIGKDDPGVGTLTSKGLPPPEGSTAIIPPRSTPKRSITPKGTLFTNLGEAHLAITARVAAKPTGQVVPTTPVNTPCESPIERLDDRHSKDDLPLASHMEFVKSSHIVNGRCLTGYAPNVPTVRNNQEAPSETSPPQSPDPIPSSPYEEFNPDLDWVHGPGPEICSKRKPRETGSTVENIYRQYLPSEPSAVEPQSVTNGTPSTGKQHPQSTETGQGEGTDDHYILAHSLTSPSPELNQTDDGINPGKQRRKLYDTAGDAPSVPLPELPIAQRSTQYHPSTNSHAQGPDSPPTPSGMSLSNTQVLLDRYSDDSELAHHEGFSEEAVIVGVPDDCEDDGLEPESSPRRAHEQLRHRLDRLHYACNTGPTEFSTGALTSESDEDPFKYDRKSYNAFLQPVREREVSLALQQLTGTESAPLDDNNNATNPFTSPTLFSQEPGQGGLQSRNPYLNRLQSYKTPAVEDAWEDEDDPNEVKIPVQRPPSSTPAPQPEPSVQNRNLAQDWRTSFYNDHFHQAQSEGGDWETVGTNVGGQFGSNLACASGTGMSGSQVIKITGSSIADYSDCSSFGPSPYDAFTSTERILQHPTDDMKPTNQLFRNIKDTGRPVFLPKPRVHRVNGYHLDSVRHFTDASTTASGSTARSALLEKISARLRRNKEQQKQTTPFQVLPGSSVPQLSDVYELEDISPGQQHAVNKGAVASGPNKENRLTPPNQESSPIAKESPTLFSFPLITLQEAVKKQAIRRASGEDDVTLTTTRTRQDSSVLSSRATQRTTPPTPCMVKSQRYTPPTPCLVKPPPTHLRRPTGLGIPDTATPYPAYRMDKGFDGHGRNRSIVSPLSSGSPPIYGRAVFPRSCRNPFGDVRADPRNSPRSSYGFPVMLRRSTHKRKTTREKRDMLRQPENTPRPGPVVDPETAGAFVLSSDDAYISWDNQRKRRLFYYGALAMCIFPFLTLLVYHGAFDPLLVWLTKGEVRRLTRKQRHVAGIVGSAIAAVWLAAIAVVVTLLVSAKA